MLDGSIEALTASTIYGKIGLLVVCNVVPEFAPHLLACRHVSGPPVGFGSKREVEQDPVFEARNRHGCVDSGRRPSRSSQPTIEAVDFGHPLVMIKNTPDLLLCRVLTHLSFHSFHHVGYGPGALDTHTRQTEVGFECIEVAALGIGCFAEDQDPGFAIFAGPESSLVPRLPHGRAESSGIGLDDHRHTPVATTEIAAHQRLLGSGTVIGERL